MKTRISMIVLALVLMSAFVSAGFNAFTNAEEAIALPEKADTIQMLESGNRGVLCVNCENKPNPILDSKDTVTCKGKCIFYAGFEKTDYTLEQWKEKQINYLSMMTTEEYVKDKLPITKDPSNAAKTAVDTMDLIDEGEPIMVKGIGNLAASYYTWPKSERHIFVVAEATIGIDNGRIKSITGRNRNSVETAWVDSFGIPLKASDEIMFYTNEKEDSEQFTGEYDYSKALLSIGPASEIKAEDWLKALPDKLKEESRSKLKLCGQEFTNYFAGSTFSISLTSDKKGCAISEYTINTALFDKDDTKNWKEFEYKCGIYPFQAIGGNIYGMDCKQTDPEKAVIEIEKGSIKKQMFRIKADNYWLSINKESQFEFAWFSEGEIRIATDKLAVSRHIEGTGGPARHKGDIIETKSKEILFVMPGHNDYIDNPLKTAQMQLNSREADTIERTAKGITESYVFRAPHTDYVLQLGNNINKAMVPIAAIFPRTFKLDNDEKQDITEADAKDSMYRILVFGAQDTIIKPLAAQNSRTIIRYDAKFRRKQFGQETNNVGMLVDKSIRPQEFIAKKCFGKEYSMLPVKDKKSVDEMIEVNALATLVPNENLRQGDILDLENSGEIDYKKEDSTLKILLRPSGCPKLREEAVRQLKKVTVECADPTNPTSIGNCVDAQYCDNFVEKYVIVGTGGESKQEAKRQCPDEKICCLDTAGKLYMAKSKASLKQKKGRIRDDSPCTKIGGTCAEKSQVGGDLACSNNWIKNKCLSQPLNNDYLCCKDEDKKDIYLEMLEKDIICNAVKCDTLKQNEECIKAGQEKISQDCGEICKWVTPGGCKNMKNPYV